MLKKLLVVLLPILIIGCADESTNDSPTPVAKETSNIRSSEEAVALAKNMYTVLHNNSRNETPEISDVTVICDKSSRENSSDTLMYAVNYADNAGFALIAAPKTVIPIMGIAECGNFNSKETKLNESFQFLLKKTKDNIKKQHLSRGDLGGITIGGTNPIKMQEQKGPRVKVTWNQRWPENIFCPNKVAGCFPVAMAQAMSYLEYPKSIKLTYYQKDKNSETLNWEEIKKHKKSLSIYEPTDVEINEHLNSGLCNTDLNHHYSLARLIRQIGAIADAYYNFNPNQTGTDVSMVLPTINYFFPNYNISNESNNPDIYDLMYYNNVVAIAIGFTPDGKGHSWVLDGSLKITIKSTLEGAMDIVGYYVHNNFGWNGNCNGFYYEGSYDTSVTPEPGKFGAKSRYDFSTNLRIYSIYKK